MSCSDHCINVFTPFWIIIQTCLHLSWCIWGTQIYECRVNIENGTLVHLWYLTYLYDISCLNSSTQVLYLPDKYVLPNVRENTTSPVQFEIEFPKVSTYAHRTYRFFQVYAVLDAVWIILTVGFLVVVSFKVKQQCFQTVAFVSLIMFVFMLTCDGITSFIFAFDIPRTYNVFKWYQFIGGQHQNEVEKVNSYYRSMVFTLPAIFMMFAFSRFVVIWIINLTLVYRIYNTVFCNIQSKNEDTGVSNLEISTPTAKEPTTIETAERIREWQLYYATTSDEENTNTINQPRKKRRISKHKRNENWKKDQSFEYSDQALTVSGGYDGDRSNSPSPRPLSRNGSDLHVTVPDCNKKEKYFVHNLLRQLRCLFAKRNTEAVPRNRTS